MRSLSSLPWSAERKIFFHFRRGPEEWGVGNTCPPPYLVASRLITTAGNVASLQFAAMTRGVRVHMPAHLRLALAWQLCWRQNIFLTTTSLRPPKVMQGSSTESSTRPVEEVFKLIWNRV